MSKAGQYHVIYGMKVDHKYNGRERFVRKLILAGLALTVSACGSSGKSDDAGTAAATSTPPASEAASTAVPQTTPNEAIWN